MIWVGTDDGNVQLTRDGGADLDQRRRQRCPVLPDGTLGARGSRPAASTSGAPTSRSIATRSATWRRTSTAPTTTAQTWTPHRRPRAGRARLRARDPARIVERPTCSSPAPSSACGSRSTAARAGRSSRAANFPAVAVRDLAVQPREHDLVLATHGRGIWIVDDITPLRALVRRRARGGRGVPRTRARRSSACRRSGGWAEGDAAFTGAESAERCRDHLLPAHAPPVREARASRCSTPSGVVDRHAPGERAPRHQPRRLVDARSSRPRAAGGAACLRRAATGRACCRDATPCASPKGEQTYRGAARRRARSARHVHGDATARRSSTRRCACTRSSAA